MLSDCRNNKVARSAVLEGGWGGGGGGGAAAGEIPLSGVCQVALAHHVGERPGSSRRNNVAAASVTRSDRWTLCGCRARAGQPPRPPVPTGQIWFSRTPSWTEPPPRHQPNARAHFFPACIYTRICWPDLLCHEHPDCHSQYPPTLSLAFPLGSLSLIYD